MGGACSTYGGEEKLKKRDLLEGLGLNGGDNIKMDCKKIRRDSNGLHYFTTGVRGGLLWMWQRTCEFHET
jgi:hypothetical protein